MEINVKLYRVCNIPTAHLKGAAGLEADAPNDISDQAIRTSFGPHFAPGFKIFWPESPGHHTTVVGMEVMGFKLTDPDVAQAGLIGNDPIDPAAIHRIDGALQSELARLGIYFPKVEDYEWRMSYAVKKTPFGVGEKQE